MKEIFLVAILALVFVGCELEQECVQWQDGQCLGWQDIDLNDTKDVDGTDGLSAYELAVIGGFVGTVEEWLKSLQGEDGEDGMSAYELAVANGYEGTLEEWLVSLIVPVEVIPCEEDILCPPEIGEEDTDIHFIIWYTRDDITDVKMQHFSEVNTMPQLKSSKEVGTAGMSIEDRNGTTIIRSSLPMESTTGEHGMGINFIQGM